MREKGEKRWGERVRKSTRKTLILLPQYDLGALWCPSKSYNSQGGVQTYFPPGPLPKTQCLAKTNTGTFSSWKKGVFGKGSFRNHSAELCLVFFCVLRWFSPANLTEISFRNCPSNAGIFWKTPSRKTPKRSCWNHTPQTLSYRYSFFSLLGSWQTEFLRLRECLQSLYLREVVPMAFSFFPLQVNRFVCLGSVCLIQQKFFWANHRSHKSLHQQKVKVSQLNHPQLMEISCKISQLEIPAELLSQMQELQQLKKGVFGKGSFRNLRAELCFVCCPCSEVIFSCKSHRNFFQKLPLQFRHFLENPLTKDPKTQLLKITYPEKCQRMNLGNDGVNAAPESALASNSQRITPKSLASTCLTRAIFTRQNSQGI